VDIFNFRNLLTRDYSEYARSFIHVTTHDVANRVQKAFDTQELWPEPLVQLNPAFATGASVPDLVKGDKLHPLCADVFRHGKSETEYGVPLDLYKHQVEAIDIARGGDNYVVTTGTGSGKSLTYIIPIVDHVLRHGSGKGIQAIVVYPMNALANSQAGELEKFLGFGFGSTPPVTYNRYTGQDDEETRRRIKENPPDILLTNYVMLELILTRGRDESLVQSASGLKYLVFDELHTYRGRQGADVAMLIRRVRDRMGGPDLQCIGTSATMGSRGGIREQREEVARVATKVFGDDVKAEHVVGETLRRITAPIDLDDASLPERLAASVQAVESLITKPFSEFVQDPLCSWVESTIGVRVDEETGTLVRQTPQRLTGPDGVAAALEHLTGLPTGSTEAPLQRLLTAGYDIVDDPASNRPLRAFAFRLHQFYNRGDTVYASPEPPGERYVTLRAQKLVPGEPQKVLLPLAFCRECGHEYYTVWRAQDEGGLRFTPRRLGEVRGTGDASAGYLYMNAERPWPAKDSLEEFQALPEDWLEEKNGELRVKYDKRERVPSPVSLLPDGRPGVGGAAFQFVPAALNFCLNCGVYYPSSGNEYSRVSVLGTGGRATATTVLSLSAIRQLQATDDLPAKARKLLSFTDNRQDASLQAGHFNDFVDVGMLRGSLYKAVRDAGDAGLGFDAVAPAVFQALDMDLFEYAANVGQFVGTAIRNDAAKSLREVLSYRIYRDLERGWRLTAPNLEQVGLLEIRYPDLLDACSQDALWADTHEALAGANAQQRFDVAKVLLEHFRRNLAIDTEWLDPAFQEQVQTRSRNFLKGHWAFDENEKLEYHTTAYPRSQTKLERGKNIYVSGRSQYARYLRRLATFPHLDAKLTVEDSQTIIKILLERLANYGFLAVVHPGTKEGQVPGYRLRPSALRWHAGDGTHPYDDPLKAVRGEEEDGHINVFFRRFYQETALHLGNLEAREHTAQVPSEWREEREEEFREGRLPVLYCSPTMELGVDIAELNIVNMRNVPPTPANYAQRSGRAGRSGQPALVFTYCATGSGHDQYYFARQDRMVAGVVEPPRLDLANEDLVRAHVHAVWLSETKADLGRSLRDVLVIDEPALPVREQLRADLENPQARLRAATRVAKLLERDEEAFANAPWYHPEWLNDTLRNAAENFDLACDRWRELYRSSTAQFHAANAVIADATKSAGEKTQAKRLRGEAENQMGLLTDTGKAMQSDFYSYRYFASEGFLPGYSFPRLPLAAYIPGRRLGAVRDEFVQRPRFLAIHEFGPRALIYHEGSKYRVTKVNLAQDNEVEGLASGRAKLCRVCGYLHPLVGDPGPDTCEHCRAQLDHTLVDLLRLQNVSTTRVARINSDEEERQRLGYEVITAVRFATSDGRPVTRAGTVKGADGAELANVTIAPAATLWRINLGWRRRENKHAYGFPLDLKSGKWASNKEAEGLDEADNDAAAEGFKQVKTVIPYVDDTRNAMLWEPGGNLHLDEAQFHTLRDALKTAIQVEYQLEENELAAELLPGTPDTPPRTILLYEAAEGGAGVLRHLLDEPTAVSRIAMRALEICHFDPISGEDQDHAPHAAERCEAACYDCLMSYSNQMSHALLDRHAIHEHLMALTAARTEASSTHLPRSEQLTRLRRLCESDLERNFLDLLERRGHRLPTHAQQRIEDAGTRPDFAYLTDSIKAVIYVDGPHHDHPERQMRDCEFDQRLDDRGYTVIRFHHYDDWPRKLEEYAWLFGPAR
jgi:ATP-dependent helicase YprA (DUF1998 family)